MTQMLNSLIFIILILLAVAFFTLMERKLLSYIQTRKGPNKVGPSGILQPFSDAIKLFSKPMTITSHMNPFMVMTAPSILMLMTLIMWPIMPSQSPSSFDNHFSMLSLILMMSMLIYPLLTTGWTSNSKYSTMGAMRSIAQMISYEVSLFMIIMPILMVVHTYSMWKFNQFQQTLWLMSGMSMLTIIWLTICLSEVNRSPFDFAEGESELVSGFNVEYAGGPFALIFLAEYTSMIILSYLTMILFSYLFSTTTQLLFISTCCWFLWTRGTLPRFRFDMLMSLNWKIILPVAIISITPISIFALHTF